MQEITQYRADDGSIHNTLGEAFRRDALLGAINVIKELLPPKPPYESGWSNGEVYLQCNPEAVKRAKELFVSLYNHQVDKQITDFNQVNGRFLDDSGTPVYGLWNMLTWIDDQNRMWGQGYYRINPNPKATEYKP